MTTYKNKLRTVLKESVADVLLLEQPYRDGYVFQPTPTPPPTITARDLEIAKYSEDPKLDPDEPELDEPDTPVTIPTNGEGHGYSDWDENSNNNLNDHVNNLDTHKPGGLPFNLDIEIIPSWIGGLFGEKQTNELNRLITLGRTEGDAKFNLLLYNYNQLPQKGGGSGGP